MSKSHNQCLHLARIRTKEQERACRQSRQRHNKRGKESKANIQVGMGRTEKSRPMVTLGPYHVFSLPVNTNFRPEREGPPDIPPEQSKRISKEQENKSHKITEQEWYRNERWISRTRTGTLEKLYRRYDTP